MMVSVLGLAWSTAGIGFISAVHLLAGLALMVALLVADLCWTEQPRAWHSGRGEPPQPPGERAGECRPALSTSRLVLNFEKGIRSP